MLCPVASAPRWNSSDTVFLVGYTLTHVRTCKSQGRKGKAESELFPTPLGGWLKVDGVQSSCNVRAGSSHPSLLGMRQPSTKSWQVNPVGEKKKKKKTNCEEQIYRFSLCFPSSWPFYRREAGCPELMYTRNPDKQQMAVRNPLQKQICSPRMSSSTAV